MNNNYKLDSDKFLNLNTTQCLYGIAVLMMVFHHLFCIPSRLGYEYIPLLGENLWYVETKLAWFCRICVGIYAFISGYGLNEQMKNNQISTMSFTENLVLAYIRIFRHLVKFMKKYWITFAVFVPLGFCFFNLKFYITEFFQNLFGLSYSYNGEWWYVKQYILMLAIFPFIHSLVLYWKKGKTEKIIFMLIGSIIGISLFTLYKYDIQLSKTWYYKVHMDYIIIFCIGCIVSEYYIFEKANQIMERYLQKKMCPVFLFIFAVIVRIVITPSASWSKGDIILVPIFIYSFTLLSKRFTYMQTKMLSLFGKYSVYIWLVHTFFAYYYFQNIILIPRYSLLIYVWLFLLSFGVAIILDKLSVYIDNCIKNIDKIIKATN